LKKLIFILLIILSIVIISNVTLAKASFGGWDKWDEELPPAEHKYWYWARPSNEPRTLTLVGMGDSGSDIVLFFSDIYFYGTKSGKKRASVIFYSSGNTVQIKDWDIPDADLALVAFPPYRGMMTIRAYKMENKVFKFFEGWEIPFKNLQVVVSKDAKFRQLFGTWLEKQMALDKVSVDPERLTDDILPELLIWDKKYFQLNERIRYKD
jgi:hypothetical protein